MAKSNNVLTELGYTAKFNNPNKPQARKSIPKPEPGKSQGVGANGAKK